MRTLPMFLLLLPVWAQQQPPTEGAKPRPPMPEPKNLKVLKMPASELIPLMRSYNAALGVTCTRCHVQGDFASDEKPEKETARKMIVMTQEINARFPDGKVYVSCYTCHRGESHPKVAPPPGSAQPGPPRPGAGPSTTPAPSTTTPSGTPPPPPSPPPAL